jgi:large subunit ribosomal protein L21
VESLESARIFHNLLALGSAFPSLTVSQADRYNLGLSSKGNFWRFLTVAYAIVQSGGKQFRVTEGEVIRLPIVSAKVGATIELDILTRGDAQGIDVGTPVLEGARVSATVVEHGRAQKVIVFKKKRRKQYKKTHGHRQDFTAVRIDSIGSRSNEKE